jgi:hypothetical protein
MVPHLGRAVAHVKARLHGSLGVDVDALATQSGHRWRKRTLTPGVVVWIFFLQILNGNLAMSGLGRLHRTGFAASSYCKARMRLPMELFTRLFDTVSRAAGAIGEQCQDSLLNGRRVLLADGTTFSMSDTPKLRRQFAYPPGQRPGIGFPMSRLLGVIDAMTGTILVAMGCPLFTHEARESLALHSSLRRGDVLVADRGFCSYLQLALLTAQGVDGVMRLHQRRKTSPLKDWIETWIKPEVCPKWMTPAAWAALPPTLSVRLVRYAVPRKNSRTRFVCVATTLLDVRAYPPATIQRLYGHRWHIETCFNQLKTHAKMNELKSQTTEGIIKELIMYLIVWNLVRMTMARFAQRAQVSVWRVSFIDTMRCLCVITQRPDVKDVKLLINPERHDRWEPRKIKRRLKEYDLLNEPRANLKAKQQRRYA